MQRLSWFAALAMIFGLGSRALAQGAITVHVRDADDRPVAGARVLVFGPANPHDRTFEVRTLGEGRTGVGGVCQISVPEEPAWAKYQVHHFRAHKDGMSWGQGFTYMGSAVYAVSLGKPVSASGKVTDQQGVPVAGRGCASMQLDRVDM